MRRKGEKGKEKEKEKEKDKDSPEKKSVRRTSRRHSKRRKHSRSSSPEPVDSDVENSVSLRKSSKAKDDNDKSQDEKDGKISTEINRTDKKEVIASADNNLISGEDDWREDTAFWLEGASKDISGFKKAEESSAKLPTLQEVTTMDSVQSATEKEKGNVLEPKGKRPKRTRKRSHVSGYEDGELAGDRTMRDDTIKSGGTSSSEAKNEAQKKIKNKSDSETEEHSGKKSNDICDSVENSMPTENSSKSAEVKSSENDIEMSPTASRDTPEDILEIKPNIEKLMPESDESQAENVCAIKSETEEGNVEKSSDSSCGTSEIESSKNLQVDTSQGICLKNEIEHAVSDSPTGQNDIRLGNDREASEESIVQQDACEGESNTSQASSEMLSKEGAAPRRSRSSDSPDLQVTLEETQDSLEELEKSVSLDELREKRKSVLDKKSASSTKKRSVSDDSTNDTCSTKDKVSLSKRTSDFKVQKTERHQARSRESGLTSIKSDCDSDRMKHEVEKEKPKRIKLCRTSRDSTGKSASEKGSEAHEHRRTTKLIRRSRSPGSSLKTCKSESNSHEAANSTYRQERILLRRSFSDKSVTRNEESREKTETSTNTDVKDKENGNLSTSTGIPTAGSISRKRRWGASKTSRTSKKPVLSISSDSLKNLIPGAKPLPVGEVQLTEDDNCKDVKLELEESWSAKVEEKEKVLIGPVVMLPEVIKLPAADEHSRFSARKISIVSDDARKLQRSPSPPKYKTSNILFITNLVRPFTVNQLKELLARTGTIVEGGFWMDKIKSKCYVQYETEEQAKETRHALHGVRWPISNPKQLCVDFGQQGGMEAAKIAGETDTVPRKVESAQLERVPPESTPVQVANVPSVEEWATAQQVRNKDRDKERDRDRDRTRAKERSGIPTLSAPAPEQRIQKMPPPVREWDLGKLGQFSPEEGRAEDRAKEKERKVRKDKLLRSRSPSPAELLARQKKRMIEGPPSRLLDDLFRKTKATPCIYWLPLTAEQIVVKEEIRRKHMAEHERRIAEIRKAERERQRERTRTQQRPHRRSGGGGGDRERDRERERDRRSGRRRSGSGSPKK